VLLVILPVLAVVAKAWRLRFFENRTGEQQKENYAKKKVTFMVCEAEKLAFVR